MQTASSQVTIQKMLTTTPPAFSAAEAVHIASSHYGIRGQVQPLVSDRDQNFRLDADDGQRYVLKISNHAEQIEVIDFQNCALEYVARQDASFPLPRVIPAVDGQLHCTVQGNDNAHFVRILSWLDGKILNEKASDSRLARQMGNLLARLGLALKGFDHPGSNPPSLWDMKRAAGLGELLGYIEDPALRQLIARTLDRFISELKPTLDTLRSQVIHNDLNLANVLLDTKRPDRISGIIDFGDMTKSPLIIDLAVAAAYQLGKNTDPLAGALPMIAGYHAIRPLQDTEMSLLTDLVRTRLITSLLIGSYRSNLFPENSEYLLTSYKAAKNCLHNLERLGADEALERIRTACVSS